MKKQILSLAIIATLPLTAHATDPVGPAAVPSNGAAVVATATPPYQTLTVSNDDKQHIASTAYVKGAYNDTIAAVNKVDNTKQAKLTNADNNHNIETTVIGTNDVAVGALYQQQGVSAVDEIMTMLADIHEELGINYNDSLISAAAVMKLVGIINESKQQTLNARGGTIDPYVATSMSEYSSSNGNNQLFTTNGVISAIDSIAGEMIYQATSNMATDLSNKRVEIYTTWDNDNAKTEVAFVNASGN